MKIRDPLLSLDSRYFQRISRRKWDGIFRMLA
jgi:hypothetical protein